MSSIASYKEFFSSVRKNYSFSGQDIRNKHSTNILGSSSKNLLKGVVNTEDAYALNGQMLQEGMFRNKVQRRYSDREYIKGSQWFKQLSPTNLINSSSSLKYQSPPKSFKTSKDLSQLTKKENVFFELIKQQLRKGQHSPLQKDLEISQNLKIYAQRRNGALNHYQQNIQSTQAGFTLPEQTQQQQSEQVPIAPNSLRSESTKGQQKGTQSLQHLKDQISILQNTLKVSNRSRLMTKQNQSSLTRSDQYQEDAKSKNSSSQLQSFKVLRIETPFEKEEAAKSQHEYRVTPQSASHPHKNRTTALNDSQRDLNQTPQSLRLEKPACFIKELKNSQNLQNLKNSIAILQNTLKSSNKSRQKIAVSPDVAADNDQQPFLSLIKQQLKQVSKLHYSNDSSESDDMNQNTKKEQKDPVTHKSQAITPTQNLTSSLKKKNKEAVAKKKYKVRFKRIPILTQTGESSVDIHQPHNVRKEIDFDV